jgi:aromatic ring-cleaving dioxygenase
MARPIASGRIKGYHAHIYYDGKSRTVAERLRRALPRRFKVELGRWREEPVGPHPQAMYQVKFTPREFSRIVPWLMLNRGGLAILVHPETGDDYTDHALNALWLGAKLKLRLGIFAAHKKSQRSARRRRPVNATARLKAS